MDEILASIRRIIADDDPGQMPPKGGETQFSSPSRAADPQSDLDRPSMRAPAPPPPERMTREDEIDSMLAHLQAATRPAPSAAPAVPSGAMAGAEPTSRLTVSDGRPDRSFEDRSSEPPAPTPAADQRPAPDAGERGLLSDPAAAAVDSAFNALAHTVQVRDGRTLEDFISELLRPMLKSWLDENLPAMVERLVRAEIERVSRGRG
jgi:cell pole-organizing protein PopZ